MTLFIENALQHRAKIERARNYLRLHNEELEEKGYQAYVDDINTRKYRDNKVW